MEKILIFVSKKKYLSKFIDIINDKFIQNKNIIAILNSEINEFKMSTKEDIIYKKFTDYETYKHNLRVCVEDAKALVKDWGNLTVKEGLIFDNLASYKDISLWKVYDYAILSFYLIDEIYFIKIISSIIEIEKPQEIILLGSKSDMICDIFLNIAKQKKISIYLYNVNKQITLRLFGTRYAFKKTRFFGCFEVIVYFPFGLYNLGLFLKNSFNTIFGKIYNLKIKPNKRFSKKILFFTTLKKQLDSAIPLVRELKKDNRICTLLVDWYWRAGDVMPVLKQEKLFHKVFDGYTTLGINKLIWNINKIFLQSWKLVESSIEFKESLKYKEVFLWNLFEPYLRELFLRHFCKAARMYEIAGRLFDIEKPQMVVVTNEREYNARICVIAAQRKKIFSLGMVREIFSGFTDQDNEPPFYTDKVIIDGNYSYEILTKGGENPDKLIVSANPRWDEAFFKKHHPQKNLTVNKLGIDTDKKLIVLITTFINPYFKQDEYERIIKSVCAALKNLSPYHLVIKLHPGDTNEKLVYELCKEIEIKNVTVIKDINIFDLILSSELLITWYSTTGLEGIAMDKPVIVVNLSKTKPEIIPFVSSGAALGVLREEDIAPVIKEILENKNTQEKLKVAREKFIPEHIQNFDGDATKRMVEIIKNIIT